MDARVYSYIVKPQNVLDMGYDELGDLAWMLIFEPRRDDDDPFAATGAWVDYYRLWTKNEWFLFKVVKRGRGIQVVPMDRQEHNLGVVPIIKSDHVETEGRYSAPALIGDTAYLDRAVANYLSNLDAIIQDQTFSQLAMPHQGLLPGDEDYAKLMEMGTKRLFTFDGEHGVAPFYLSPDPKQATIIVEVVNKIISEIYHSVGLAGERTKQDNAVGIDNSSGVAKAYDFDRVNTLLCAKAESLDRVENKLVAMVRRWHSKTDATDEDLVKYPDNYDVRGLYDELDVAARLSLVDAPMSARQEQMKALIEKLFPRIEKALKDKMLKEIDDWAGEEGTPNRPSLVPSQENRQGQVTGDDNREAQAQ